MTPVSAEAAAVSGVLDAAPPREIAVEGAEALAPRGGDVTDARARSARRLRDGGAGHEQIGQQPFAGHDLEDAARAGEGHEVNARRDLPALEGLAYRPHVFPRGVRARADHHLVDGRARDLAGRHHLVGGSGQGHQRLERAEVERDLLVVLRVGIRGERLPAFFPAEQREVVARRLVGGEDARGQRQLGAHVADGRALGQGQRGGARARVLEDLPAAAAHAVAPQQLEDHVLGVHPGLELAREGDADDARHGQVIGAASHGHGHVEPARSDGEHARRAAERGVAVRAEDELARHAERLEVDLVADAVARLGEPGAIARGCRLEVTMVVGVARVGLVDVVVDVRHDARGLDAGEAHGLELEPGHVAVGVGEQALVHAQRDLLAGHGLAGDEVRVDQLAREVQAHG